MLDKFIKTLSFPRLRSQMYIQAFMDQEVADRFARGLIKAGWPKPHGYYKINVKNRLKGERIKELLFGRKRSGFTLYRGTQWWAETTEEGKYTFYYKPTSPYNGKQWIEGDMLCTQYNKRFKGLKFYQIIFRNPEGTAEKKDEYLGLSDLTVSAFSIVD